MPSEATIEKFIARAEENAHAEAIAEFYTENATMQENQATPRIGRKSLVENEKSFLSKVATVSSKCIRPVFVNGDHVVVRWEFRFDFPNGTYIHMEELAYQRWEGERIAQEQFFYDPAQRVPRQRPDK